MKSLITINKAKGMSSIYRGGERVGDWARVGYDYTVERQGSGRAGTYACAQYKAELLAYDRALTPISAAEIQKSEDILDKDTALMMDRYPFSKSEVESLEASCHRDLIARHTVLKARWIDV